MTWYISFISEADFTEHVRTTIQNYGNKLEPYNLAKFNSNTIDPIKLLFDNAVYQSSWEETIKNEIFRQRDKSNNNDIGYFHQYMFKYIKNCKVPNNGEDGGWDVIYSNPDGIKMPDDTVVHKIYAEMKNKYNTMNSASANDTFKKMQKQLLDDDDCACFLVEAISKRSQNIVWAKTINKKKVKHKLIRRVSIDKFYEIVTGCSNAFFDICLVLPETIKNVVSSDCEKLIPVDIAYNELLIEATKYEDNKQNDALIRAIYQLAFSSYSGFTN